MYPTRINLHAHATYSSDAVAVKNTESMKES